MSKTQPRHILRLVAAGMTDVGRQRRHNEDNVLVAQSLDLFVVADGMGGHSTGHVASALTATSMQNFFEATQQGELPLPTPNDEVDLPRPAERLAQAVRKANRDVYEISSTHKEHRGMGSTIVAIHYDGGESLHIAHVGDSRCYRIRDAAIEQLTRDHSLINDALALKPDLTEEELARLPKNVITRALGMKDAVKVDVQTVKIEPGDMFLLCSDGLSGMISNDQILEVFDLTTDLSEACELLIAMANEAGGVDNISALLVRADDAPPPSEAQISAMEEDAPDLAVEEVAASIPFSQRYRDIQDSEGVRSYRPPPGDPIEEMVVGAELDGMREVMTPEDLAMLAASSDVETDGPRSIDEIRVARCKRCDHELYVGNAFCTECGWKIESD
ncbi:Stp1/IreP family PP2C-type Ser/Thr phosphatase [Polyangium sp. y55x31]|uniref:Stp1/IreP family PP2C-type Ser/Thr phosphatase n=1 Tax=Polyangium sp. y55x31 TaxID=3042688 RepID=UPI0024829495|nr:Stp1/IreP family PP2C-type Ser/Thr phosphatase [Polyangium sp. y55x31]MDI1481400.1 Stp1/IreP family PP2C-type Ser/Thr phosphatase [Polyangium sp. y55x31]